MRLFITTYQKSGTHQIMPMFEPIPDIEDRSHCSEVFLFSYLGKESRDYDCEGIGETAYDLAVFDDRRFGHISYRPEYIEALQQIPTKVIFNVRDPRDIIVAEYRNMERTYSIHGKTEFRALWDWYDNKNGMYIFDKGRDETLIDLIHFASIRWQNWIQWLDHEFVLPVKYEDLRLNALETCQEIYDWLMPEVAPPVGVEEMVQKAKPRRRNPTFRRGIPGEWITTFDDRHMKLADELLGDIIVRLGYKLWERKDEKDI